MSNKDFGEGEDFRNNGSSENFYLLPELYQSQLIQLDYDDIIKVCAQYYSKYYTQYNLEHFFKEREVCGKELWIAKIKTFPNIYQLFLDSCIFGWTLYVYHLLKYFNVNPQFSQNQGLINAVKNGHIRIVEILLSYNVDVNSRYGLALTNSVNNHHTDIVELLLSAGADPNIDNGSPLIFSIKRGYIDIIQLILDDPRTDLEKYGKTALMISIDNNKYNITRLLLSYPKITDSLDKSDKSDLSKRLKYLINDDGIEIVKIMIWKNLVKFDVETFAELLDLAAYRGYWNLVALLLEYNRKNEYNLITPYYHSYRLTIYRTYNNNQDGIMVILLDDPNLRNIVTVDANSQSHHRSTALNIMRDYSRYF